jgi:5,10-methylenetetrahydrofolate reductase
MSTRSRSWVVRRRIGVGAQFLTTGPVMDPTTVHACFDRLALRDGDPPVYLELAPPFSASWVRRLERVGAIEVSEGFRARLAATPESDQRRFGWRAAKAIAERARAVGFAGVVLMGLKFETAVGEAYEVWHDTAVTSLDGDEAGLISGVPE